jgi:hypothetical protein
VSVASRGDLSSENGGYSLDGVLARTFHVRKLMTLPILRKLSVEMLMKIVSWHGFGSLTGGAMLTEGRKPD